jgi:hypothetical protein
MPKVTVSRSKRSKAEIDKEFSKIADESAA